MPRTVIACNTRVTEGMVISTQSKKAKESQQVVLEFLLANHPLDCPVCDQAGECKLQDYYMDYGLYDPKFNDTKVKKSKKAFSIGPTVMLDQERCILCSRCVRFGDEITKTHDFGIFTCQPPVGLPGLRSGGGVQASGLLHGLWVVRPEV